MRDNMDKDLTDEGIEDEFGDHKKASRLLSMPSSVSCPLVINRALPILLSSLSFRWLALNHRPHE